MRTPSIAGIFGILLGGERRNRRGHEASGAAVTKVATVRPIESAQGKASSPCARRDRRAPAVPSPEPKAVHGSLRGRDSETAPAGRSEGERRHGKDGLEAGADGDLRGRVHAQRAHHPRLDPVPAPRLRRRLDRPHPGAGDHPGRQCDLDQHQHLPGGGRHQPQGQGWRRLLHYLADPGPAVRRRDRDRAVRRPGDLRRLLLRRLRRRRGGAVRDPGRRPRRAVRRGRGGDRSAWSPGSAPISRRGCNIW